MPLWDQTKNGIVALYSLLIGGRGHSTGFELVDGNLKYCV